MTRMAESGCARQLTPQTTEDGAKTSPLSEICPIISEILDPSTQKTIVDSKHLSLASDFCHSNKLVAQVMTMIAEERAVKDLLNELLEPGGACIAVVPSSRYCFP